MLARQDGRRPGLCHDRYRVRDACLAAEQRYGLRPTAPADRTAARRPSRAETGKTARRGLGEPPRVTLRRHVTTAAAASGSEEEFFARLEAAGVIARRRLSVTSPGHVTGYAVALPGDTGTDGGPVWYGGGKLAADPTWPKLRQRWTSPGTVPVDRLTAAERNAVWEHATRAAADAAAQVRGNPAAAADAAWATSDTLHVAAAALGSRILRQAADAYDPGRPRPLRPHPGPQPGREPAPAGRPAYRRVRPPDPRPGTHAGCPHHEAGRARRSRRRAARIPAACHPGRRPRRRRTPVCRRPTGTRCPGTSPTTCPHGRPPRGDTVSRPASPAPPRAARARAARPGPARPRPTRRPVQPRPRGPTR
jgi:hypothetical protein